MSGDVTIGALKRLSLYMAGQLASAVAITGGTIANVAHTGGSITGATISGTISGNTVRCTTQLDKTTSATLANIVGLVQTVVPGTYEFEIHLTGVATANGGMKAAFKYTTAVASVINASAYAFTASAVAVAQATTATDQASILASTTAIIGVIIKGTVVVTTGGTMQLQFAQNASHSDTSSIYVGSTMKFTRIA